MNIYIPTAEELRALRGRLKLTQAEAAARIGVARRTWMYWENPSRNARPSKAAARLIAMLAAGKLPKNN